MAEVGGEVIAKDQSNKATIETPLHTKDTTLITRLRNLFTPKPPANQRSTNLFQRAEPLKNSGPLSETIGATNKPSTDPDLQVILDSLS